MDGEWMVSRARTRPTLRRHLRQFLHGSLEPPQLPSAGQRQRLDLRRMAGPCLHQDDPLGLAELAEVELDGRARVAAVHQVARQLLRLVDVAEGRVRDRGQVLKVGGVVLPDLDLALAAGKHGVAHVQVGGEDADVTADVEAVEQSGGQALLDQVDPVGVQRLPRCRVPRSRRASGWRARTGAGRGVLPRRPPWGRRGCRPGSAGRARLTK